MIQALPDTEFWRAYQGRFQGVLTWDAFDALWQKLAESGGEWFIFDLETDAPERPGDLVQALGAARQMYADVRDRSYCGTVYVDDLAAPGLVKVFDPYKMGATCGSSGERTMPRYVFSRSRPDPLPAPAPEPAPSFWSRLVGQR